MWRLRHIHSSFHFSPSFLWKEVPRRGGGWLSKRDEVVGSTVFPVIPLLTSFLDRKRKRFLAFARNDDVGGKAAHSLLPLEGGAP